MARLWRKTGILLIIFLLFAVGFTVSYMVYPRPHSKLAPGEGPDADQSDAPVDLTPRPQTLLADAQIFLLTLYDECGHPEVPEHPEGVVTIPDPALVGKGEQEVAAFYPGYTMTGFTPERVDLVRHVPGLCPTCQNYMYIGVLGDNLVVFRGLPGLPNPVVKQDLGARLSELSLSAEDVQRLRAGIPIANDEELQAFLEGLQD